MKSTAAARGSRPGQGPEDLGAEVLQWGPGAKLR